MLTCCRADVLACFGALVLTCSVYESSERQRASSVIAGSVVDATTGQAVTGATVTLKRAGPVEAAVVVDSRGRFVIAELGPGTYTLSATTPAGYAQGFASVELGQDERIIDVPVRMRRHGSISGTVRDDAGDPVAGTPVGAFLRTTFLARPVLFGKGSAIADDRGQFRIVDLPAGEYVICVCNDPGLQLDAQLLTRLGPRAPSVAAVARTLGDRAFRVVPSFHPHGPAPSSAMKIKLETADDRSGIDITVNFVRAVRVAGHLLGVSTNASVDMTLLLVPDGDLEALGATGLSPVYVTPEGAFEFAAVPPGRYSFEAFPKDPRKGAWASVPLSVGNRDVPNLAVALNSGATVSGQLQFSGAATRPAPTALQETRIGLLPVDSTLRMMQSAGTAMLIGHSGTVAADGTFRVEHLAPGRYTISVIGLAPWTTDTVRTGEGVGTDTLLTVSGRDLTGVQITMTDAAQATIEATVTLEKYEAPQGVKVLLYPADSAMWAEPYLHPRRFFVSSSDTSTFRFPPVPPGDYFVTMEAGELSLASESLETWSRRATRITLKPGETTTIGLRR